MASVIFIKDWGIFGTYPQWIFWFSFLWKQFRSSKLQLLDDAKKCTVSVDSWEICFKNTLLLQTGLTVNPPLTHCWAWIFLPPRPSGWSCHMVGWARYRRKGRNTASCTAPHRGLTPNFNRYEMGAFHIKAACACFGTGNIHCDISWTDLLEAINNICVCN